MFKKAIFQLHWFLGIAAGLVLAVMGVSGAAYTFQDEILDLLNPHLTVDAGGAPPLPLGELLARAEAQQGTAVTGIWQKTDAEAPTWLFFAPRAGESRGASRYANRYTGELLAERRGTAFFALMLKVHRYLALDAVGKQITAASTLGLVYLCLSGLYLRWPRRGAHWRAWLALNPSRKGRAFLWDLHAVAGTWCLAIYLLVAVTGLYWSYDWYREGLTRLLDDAPVEGSSVPEPTGTGPARVDMEAVRRGLEAAAGPGLGLYSLRLPERAGEPLTVFVLDRDADHPRAFDELTLDPVSGALLHHDRYADKSFGARLLASVYALHVGEYFGLPGRVLIMLASLGMPLFFVTGWLLYLDRRRKRWAADAARGEPAPAVAGEDAWLVGFASQSGFAEQLAWQAARQLRAAGLAAEVLPVARIDAPRLQTASHALFVASTFGDGDAPDSARGFERGVLAQRLDLAHLHYAVLALGDRQYARYCAFAQRLDGWLGSSGARSLFDPVEVDNGDALALDRWQRQLADLTGAQPLQHAEEPYLAWRLAARECLNPGSQGRPTYRVALRAETPVAWSAGDILEVLPRHGEARVRDWLQRHGIDGSTWINVGELAQPLHEALATRQLPDRQVHLVGLHPQGLYDALVPLGSREYSIASLPADGVLELIVRQEQGPDGWPGLGSGWLTLHAPLEGRVLARVRRNSGFHPPEDDRPLVLIGNGTGLAGLRSLLKARIAEGHTRNWLIFGERNAAHDFYCREELRGWQRDGGLARLDLAFSRDQAERVYVQHRLRDAADDLRHWLADGAALYVCGSLAGMAEEVDRTLVELLGAAAVDRLSETGRYRRDVY
ncbi:PepSY domain-containing protein [Pseudomonas mangiferae]|uniref:PepSY domain-containing protein n=1 Tax=Pseudomonas mangiferae TaxID=2593654 RepID=UPI001E378D04|nr:sulfite reductase flavoprotein subunit alpha [Pseudomonas mangiferae]